MWKSITISQQTYFIYCNINASKEDVTLILYDLKEAWCQTVAFKDVKLNVKALNKRFDFNEDHIKEALTNGELRYAAIEEQPHTSANRQDTLLLKVKYGIKNCVLNYEWSLRRQSLLEFQADFVQPLLLALFNCWQQVEILTDCVRKKDAELHQYRLEGAVLGRTTLATKPFDFYSFNKKYEESNKIANNFKELARYVLETKSSSDATITSGSIKLQPAEKNEKLNNIEDKANKEASSPSKRKRRREIELLHLERYLKIRKEGGIQYESSQSQSLSSENSQTHEEIKNEVIKEKSTYEADNNEHNNYDEAAESQRKSTRSLSAKERCEQKTVEATNSDSDCLTISPKGTGCKVTKQKDNAQLRSLRERKLNNPVRNSTENSQIKSPNIFEYLTVAEERKKSLQESQTKSPSPVKGISLRHSTPLPPVIDDLSSQLNNIKKELECLEAMRLADLKKRSCKA